MKRAEKKKTLYLDRCITWTTPLDEVRCISYAAEFGDRVMGVFVVTRQALTSGELRQLYSTDRKPKHVLNRYRTTARISYFGMCQRIN